MMVAIDQNRIAKLLAWSVLLGLIVWVAVSYAEGGIVGLILGADLAAADKLELLVGFFEGLGVFAPLAYIALVTVEVVVAPIPGTIFYAPAGVIFGGLWGGVFSLIGNILGAVVSFILMRVLGRSAFERFIEHEHLERLESRVSDNGALVVFFLRVNPLTSSDIVSYAAKACLTIWAVEHKVSHRRGAVDSDMVRQNQYRLPLLRVCQTTWEITQEIVTSSITYI